VSEQIAADGWGGYGGRAVGRGSMKCGGPNAKRAERSQRRLTCRDGAAGRFGEGVASEKVGDHHQEPGGLCQAVGPQAHVWQLPPVDVGEDDHGGGRGGGAGDVGVEGAGAGAKLGDLAGLRAAGWVRGGAMGGGSGEGARGQSSSASPPRLAGTVQSTCTLYFRNPLSYTPRIQSDVGCSQHVQMGLTAVPFCTTPSPCVAQ